jgi:hypothetical protein
MDSSNQSILLEANTLHVNSACSHAMVKSFGQSIAISATQLYDRPLITSAVGITGENAKGIMIGQCLMCVKGHAATSPGLGLQKWGLMKAV